MGNDSNEYLIDFWNKMQEGFDLKSVVISKKDYDEIRKYKECFPKYIVAIAGILASYNSKWFAGYAKTHVVKISSGKGVVTRNYFQESVNNVLKQMSNLADVKFISGDYKKSCLDLYNAMIYCDPPYEGTTGFKDKFNHNDYWQWVREISKDNFVLCSEYNSPDDFIKVWQGEVKITLDNQSRNRAVEKLFTYKDGKYAEYMKGQSNE